MVPPSLLRSLYVVVDGEWRLSGSREAPIVIEDDVIMDEVNDEEERAELKYWADLGWDWEVIKEGWWEQVYGPPKYNTLEDYLDIHGMERVDEWPYEVEEEDDPEWAQGEEESEE